VIFELVNLIRSGGAQSLLKPIGILMHLNLERKKKEVEFGEFKRSAGIFDENDELFSRVLMPLSHLMQLKEEGI